MVSIRCEGRCKGDQENKIFTGIHGVIFDKDGTLEDSSRFLMELALQRIKIIESKVKGTAEGLAKVFGIKTIRVDPHGLMAVGTARENLIAAASHIASTGKSWYESLEIASAAFEIAGHLCTKTSSNCLIFPEVPHLFNTLHRIGVKIAILSSDTTDNIQKFLDNHQLREYVDVIQGGEGELTKPNPLLYLKVCESIGVLPVNTLMVGDTQMDIMMAKAAKAGGSIGVSGNHVLGDITIKNLSKMHICPRE